MRYSISCRAIGRRSLDATKLLCSLTVRAAVDFFRGACPLPDDFLLAVPDELFALEDFLEAAALLLDSFLEGGVSCAAIPLPCSSNNADRVAAVIRLINIVVFSLTRFCAAPRAESSCTVRFRHVEFSTARSLYINPRRHRITSRRRGPKVVPAPNV